VNDPEPPACKYFVMSGDDESLQWSLKPGAVHFVPTYYKVERTELNTMRALLYAALHPKIEYQDNHLQMTESAIRQMRDDIRIVLGTVNALLNDPNSDLYPTI
jgi:hypothetical protein